MLNVIKYMQLFLEMLLFKAYMQVVTAIHFRVKRQKAQKYERECKQGVNPIRL